MCSTYSSRAAARWTARRAASASACRWCAGSPSCTAAASRPPAPASAPAAPSRCLPRCAAPQAERRNPPLPQSTPQGKPSVLLIEDNDDGREMMSMMLSCYGYDVQHAADGLSGLQLAVRLHPGLALVDIGLPGIDGYEVARRLRADPATRDMRLIALTGYGLAEDRRRVLEAGFDLHLVKPVEIEQLIEAIGSGAPLAVKP